jgi:hypothetical protein
VLYANSTTSFSQNQLSFDGSRVLLIGGMRVTPGIDISYRTTAIGYEALSDITSSGLDDTAVGYGALANVTSAIDATAVGSGALTSLSTGGQNTAIGANSLRLTNGTGSTAIGWRSGFNSTGSFCVAVGGNSLKDATGNDNICIGYSSGELITSGARNIVIGRLSDTSGPSVSDEIVVGYSLVGKGADTAYIGGTNGAYNEKNVTTWETTSDERIKKNIVDNNVGLGVIDKIRVRNFEYRESDEIVDLPKHAVVRKGGVQLGVIAQELREVLPQSVYENSTGVLSINTDALVWHLINSVKELSARVRQLEGRQ